MEKNHFSHIHNLGQQQMIPQGHEIICSGCKLQASGLVHGCWECKFFLHDQCFTASRAMIHPSHPSHPLTLAPYPTYPSNTFFCNSCNLVGTGFAYSCSLCEFDIHVHCAYMSNPTAHLSSPSFTSYENNVHQNFVPNNSGSIPAYPPQTYNPQNPYVNHNVTPNPNTSSQQNSTPTHSASHNHDKMPNTNPQSGATGETKHFTHGHAMYLSEVREKQMKICSGCDENITGLAYVCKDNQCDFNLHKSCFDLPQEIRHNSHPKHPLRLIISPDQNNGYTCNGCHKKGFSFTYNCRICNFDLHTDCASLPKTVKRKDHEHPLTLYYEMNGEFRCDACQETSEGCWRYRCRKCDFDTHPYCVTSTAKPVISNPELDYYNESEKVMAALLSAKIKHDSNAFIINHLI
ncbi:hypothetical protein POM88_000905 [Heracleum sosnowskyi]|uniref:DC1 domain-containing protein n=1 Tax=Heracleum sosnowskyi TaxID=360622 RepID=A0AAD8JB51_9APIA|nr:hypothetical protein POM88_000905 [Heracleum sosnowskyi]